MQISDPIAPSIGAHSYLQVRTQTDRHACIHACTDTLLSFPSPASIQQNSSPLALLQLYTEYACHKKMSKVTYNFVIKKRLSTGVVRRRHAEVPQMKGGVSGPAVTGVSCGSYAGAVGCWSCFQVTGTTQNHTPFLSCSHSAHDPSIAVQHSVRPPPSHSSHLLYPKNEQKDPILSQKKNTVSL